MLKVYYYVQIYDMSFLFHILWKIIDTVLICNKSEACSVPVFSTPLSLSLSLSLFFAI
jgi:hypothetical protein